MKQWGLFELSRLAFDPHRPTNIPFSLTIVEGLTFISSAEERLDSSWQSLGAVVPCFADAASPAPNFAQPLD